VRRFILLKHLTALIILSASLFILDQTSLFSSASGLVGHRILEPTVSQTRGSLNGATNYIASILSIRSLANKVALVERERDYYRGEYLRLESVAEENGLLRQALQIENDSQQLTLAKVVSFNTLLPLDMIEIDKGSASGIKAGDAVITENRVLIGIISTVEDTSSMVRLVTSESSSIPALLASSGTHASLRGSATGAINLDLIPRDVQVVEGELVITSGITGSVQSHLLVGDIQRVIDDETASFKRAIVRPLANAPEINHVFVITSF